MLKPDYEGVTNMKLTYAKGTPAYLMAAIDTIITNEQATIYADLQPIPLIDYGDFDGRYGLAFYEANNNSLTKISKPVRIGFDSTYFDDEAKVTRVIRDNVASGWFSSDYGIDHIIRHEFAHHIDSQLSNLTLITKQQKFHDLVFVELAAQYTLSKYARQNTSEAFAEAFADGFGDTPTQDGVNFKLAFNKLSQNLLK